MMITDDVAVEEAPPTTEPPPGKSTSHLIDVAFNYPLTGNHTHT